MDAAVDGARGGACTVSPLSPLSPLLIQVLSLFLFLLDNLPLLTNACFIRGILYFNWCMMLSLKWECTVFKCVNIKFVFKVCKLINTFSEAFRTLILVLFMFSHVLCTACRMTDVCDKMCPAMGIKCKKNSKHPNLVLEEEWSIKVTKIETRSLVSKRSNNSDKITLLSFLNPLRASTNV